MFTFEHKQLNVQCPPLNTQVPEGHDQGYILIFDLYIMCYNNFTVLHAVCHSVNYLSTNATH